MVYGNNSQTICKKCAAGQFAAGENGNETAPGDPKLSCVACEEGKYSTEGWTTCQECRAGQRWVDVTTPCEDCVAGTNFSDQSGQLVCTSCKECTRGNGRPVHHGEVHGHEPHEVHGGLNPSTTKLDIAMVDRRSAATGSVGVLGPHAKPKPGDVCGIMYLCFLSLTRQDFNHSRP